MAPEVDLNAADLEDRLSALESARSWSPRVVSRLESRIRSAEDIDLFRVNPKAYAATTSMAEAEAIDLFLHAAHVGLFQMEWNLVCASCGNTARSFRSLEKVDPHFICETCQMENDSSLDELIQVTFTIAPSVRRISYHEPGSLSPEELYFRYQFSRDVLPTTRAMTLRQLEASTHFIGHVEPGETVEVEFSFDGDAFAVRDILHAAAAMYLAAPGTADDADADPAVGAAPNDTGEPSRTDVALTLREGRLVDRDRTLKPIEYSDTSISGESMRLLFPGGIALARGPLRVSIENAMTERSAAWVVEYPKIPERYVPIEFEPILSAKQALSTQTFRDLFRSQTVAASEGLEVRDLTFLFTDLRDSTAMYERIGDASAYNLVRLHFDALGAVIRENGGAIVKTIGDAIMATFVAPTAGIRAAMQMSSSLEDFNRSSSSDLALKMGLHRGHAIAVTSNDAVDYFGQTVNIAARIQALAGSGEVCVSEDVYQSAGVAEQLAGLTVEREAGIMKGVAEEIPIYRAALV